MKLKTPKEMTIEAAARFKRMRRAKRVTIKELSEKSGVPYSTVRRFESSGEVSFLSLVKMVSVLGEDAQIESLFDNAVPSSIEEVIRDNRR